MTTPDGADAITVLPFPLAVTANGIVRRVFLPTDAEQGYGKGAAAQVEPAAVAIGLGRTVRVLPAP